MTTVMSNYLEISFICHSFQKDSISSSISSEQIASAVIRPRVARFVERFSSLILAEQTKCDGNVITYLFYRSGHASAFAENLMPIKSIHPDAYANSCGSCMIPNGPVSRGTLQIRPKNHPGRKFCSPALGLCCIDSRTAWLLQTKGWNSPALL